MLKLKNVTLIALTSVKIDKTIKALEYSSKDIDFGAIKLVSDIKPDNLPNNIQYEKCPKMSNIDEWNYAAIYELGKHVDTDFAILIHDDGYIINASSWKDEFYNYLVLRTSRKPFQILLAKFLPCNIRLSSNNRSLPAAELIRIPALTPSAP
jgi:hypothetical protein